MTQIIQLGQPPIEVNIKRSSRARRLSLRVSGVDGRVSLTVPKVSSLSEAQSFLCEKEHWIRKHLNKQPKLVAALPGSQVPVEGIMREIVETTTRVVKLHPYWIEVPQGSDKAGARLRGFLKTMARDRLAAASAKYAAKLDRSFGKLTLRDTRSRWGSCTTEGNLMYSWRLIMAPCGVLDYVAAHEVSHLSEMNHSPAFWAEVTRLMPDYDQHRIWLRKNGSALHRYTF